MVAEFERNPNPQDALDMSRSLEEDLADGKIPDVELYRIYCQIISGLCNIRLTEPSEATAEMLERAAEMARRRNRLNLSMLADWYATCCRLMRFIARGEPRPDPVLRDIAQRFRYVSQQASVLRAWRLQAVARSLAVECMARLQVPPHNLEESVRGALRDLEAAERDAEGAVEARIRRMHDILEQRELSAQLQEYQLLLYRPGSLLLTLQ